MKKFYDTVIDQATGQPRQNATVTVTDGTGAAVQLYSDDGITPIEDPINRVVTDVNGLFQFYVANGTYTLTIQYAAATPVVLKGIQIYQDVTVIDGLGSSTINPASQKAVTNAIAATVIDSMGTSTSSAPSQNAIAASTAAAGVGAADGNTVQDNLDGRTIRYASVSAMLAGNKPPAGFGNAICDGYYSAGDGGGGSFYWDDSSSATADNGFVFALTAGGAGRWKRSAAPHSSTWINVRWFGAKADNSTDDILAIQAACNYAARLRGTVYFPNGQYKISDTIKGWDITSGTPGNTACAIVGEGMFSTRFIPSGDITAVWLVSGYMDQGGFSVEWPLTARGSIPTTRIGVEIADANHMVSQCRIHDIIVMYAYRSFYHADWTSAGTNLGTAYVIDYERLISFRAADWGFYIQPAKGSATTHRYATCWANCSDSTGVAGGTGFWISGVNDVVMVNCAVDFCTDRAIRVGSGTGGTGYQVNLIGTALESCKVTSQAVPLIHIDDPIIANIFGIKEIATTVSLPSSGSTAFTVFSNRACTINISGYARSQLNVVLGTLAKASINSASTRINCDSSIAFNEVADQGYYTNISWGGTRYSSTGNIPAGTAAGTNQQGDYVRNMKPSAGSPAGWECRTAGTPGTWEVVGQVGVLGSIAAAPAFVGQVAVVSGVGYVATGTSATTDWKQTTP